MATLKVANLNSGASLYKMELSWQLNIIALGIICCVSQLHIEVQIIIQNKFEIEI